MSIQSRAIGTLASDLDINIDTLPIRPLPADTLNAAVMQICGHARDAAEAHRLLMMLGLEGRA